MKNSKLFLISITVVVISVACSKKTPIAVANEQVICVKAETIAETKVAMPIQCSGIITSKRMMKLSFKTGGIISGINFDEGMYVRKGQVIASLDLTEISSQVSQSVLACEKSSRDLQRIRNLYNDSVATLEQFQDATSAYEAALENKNIAEFNQRFSRIIAPANGKIIARMAEENELVGPGMPVIVFSEQGNDEWVVKAGIADKDIVRVRKGDKAIAELDAFPGITFPAKVSQVAETADPLSGTFEIEINVDPGNEKLINGLVAKVKVEPLNFQVVTLVPPEAVTEADGRRGYVYVVKTTDTTARKVPVTIAYLHNNHIAVMEPVNKIGQIITSGASYLADGSKINISK